MKKEKAVLSFVAIFVGLLAAGIAFYLFQLTKTIPLEPPKVETARTPTTPPTSEMFLVVSEPTDEKVSSAKVVKFSGKTVPGSSIAIMGKNDYDVVQPSRTGDFSTTINIEDGVNLIRVTAIAPDGQENTLYKTVSFTSENF